MFFTSIVPPPAVNHAVRTGREKQVSDADIMLVRSFAREERRRQVRTWEMGHLGKIRESTVPLFQTCFLCGEPGEGDALVTHLDVETFLNERCDLCMFWFHPTSRPLG